MIQKKKMSKNKKKKESSRPLNENQTVLIVQFNNIREKGERKKSKTAVKHKRTPSSSSKKLVKQQSPAKPLSAVKSI